MELMGHVEDEITPFLKARRAALDPVELGLPAGPGRRRVRGLRREEVAQRAGISVDYYTRIEQGRAPAISDAVLDAVARALRLTEHEHTYLRNITLPHRRGGACADVPRPRVRPQVQELLDAMGETVPAMVIGPATDILAWNRLAAQVQFDYDALPESELNSARLLFTHPEARTRYPDWAEIIEDTVANLRAEIGRSPDQPRLHRVIWELRAVSPEFRELWERQSVRVRNSGVKRINHPEVGELVLTFEAFELPADPEQRLCTYTAPKGSLTEERMRALMAPAVV
jgi:transcriptional regulator with XRE-family HTH domain